MLFVLFGVGIDIKLNCAWLPSPTTMEAKNPSLSESSDTSRKNSAAIEKKSEE